MSTEIPDIRPDYYQANYDESKIAPFTLEDPLTFLDGTPVKSPADWPRRRKEILSIFAKNMFGEEPPKPETMVTELVEEKVGALAGFAVRSQYRMWFHKDKTGPAIDWLLLRPRYAKGPVPVIIFLNFQGNQELIPDQEVIVPSTAWDCNTKDHHLPDVRGIYCNPNSDTVIPIGILLSAGYAVLTACYCQISPDPKMEEPEERFQQKTFAYTGVFELWGKRDESRDDNTTAIGAWAWALSRGLDLAERIPELDAKKAIATGCSRLGKTALLAAARDERFPVCMPVQSGGGGVPLAKHDYGENVATESRMFTHWFCPAYAKYARNPAKLLTFDQHLLVASIAPRRILVPGFNERWFDTMGDFLSCQAASPAWELFGLPGLPKVSFPEPYDTSAIGPYLGYFRRTENHGIAAFDWWMLLNFLNRK